MRRLLLATTVLTAALAGSALAADLPMRAPAPAPYAVPIFTWTGFYVGVNGGYAGDEYRYNLNGGDGREESFQANAHITSSGFVGGGQIGYNWQLSSPLVLGIEADIQASGLKGELGLGASFNGGPGFSASAGSKTDYFGTVRGRLGWAGIDRLLAYVTGGFAYGETKSYYSISGLGDGSKSSTHGGWTVGGGLEYAVLPNWTIKAEYLYVDLGKTNIYSGDLITPNTTLDVKTRFNVVRAGVNYRF